MFPVVPHAARQVALPCTTTSPVAVGGSVSVKGPFHDVIMRQIYKRPSNAMTSSEARTSTEAECSRLTAPRGHCWIVGC